MAIEYTLHLADPRGADAFRAAFAAALGAVASPGRRRGTHHVELDALYATLLRPDPSSAAFYRDAYAVRPTVTVFFRLDKFALDRAQRTLVDTVLAALAASTGDAVLLWNGERPVLRRVGGAVSLDGTFGVWHALRPLIESGTPLAADFEP